MGIPLDLFSLPYWGIVVHVQVKRECTFMLQLHMYICSVHVIYMCACMRHTCSAWCTVHSLQWKDMYVYNMYLVIYMYVHCTMVIISHVLYLISSTMQISASSSREYYDNVYVYVPLYWVKPHQLYPLSVYAYRRILHIPFYWVKPHQLYPLSGRFSMNIDHNEFGKCHLYLGWWNTLKCMEIQNVSPLLLQNPTWKEHGLVSFIHCTVLVLYGPCFKHPFT